MTLRFAARLVPLFVLAVTFAACQQQGQGAPCNTQNGNNDCQSGLACISVSGVDGTRCCPSGASSSQDCTSSGTTADANTPPTGDGASAADSGDATVQDAPPGDAPFEGGADGMPEASPGDAEAGIPVDSGSDASSD